MRGRGSAILGALALVTGLARPAPAFAADIHLSSGGQNLAEAVAQATPGDRLLLEPGLYAGTVVVNKPLTIEGTAVAVIEGDGIGSVVKVFAPNVSLRGLTIKNSGTKGENYDSGIYIEQGADHPVIENNSLEGNLFGIVLHGCNDAVVRNNHIANRNDLWLNDRGNGIHVWNSTGSQIEENRVEGGRDGIYIEISHGNVIHGNRFENLRFAIHYMYANRNEISDNLSIRNHVGFALMYSDHLEVLRNISIADLQYGLMIHTTHDSEVARNYVYGTGEKCLFLYTSANDDIHDNRFENCGVAMHFTGGSENDKVYGNQFIGGEKQVKYTGTRAYEWSENGRGNYWSDNPAFDLNGDGIADTAYRPNTLVDWVLWKYPLAKLLASSPAMQTLRYVQEQFPTLYPGGAADSFPLMSPGAPPVKLPEHVDLTPAPRDPAQLDSDSRPMM
jgi:nitrous oxidase accessory protein